MPRASHELPDAAAVARLCMGSSQHASCLTGTRPQQHWPQHLTGKKRDRWVFKCRASLFWHVFPLLTQLDICFMRQKGETFVSLNGALMDMYLKKYSRVEREDFVHFTTNAHANATSSPHATLPKRVSVEDYKASVRTVASWRQISSWFEHVVVVLCR
jgi:hypothetical protein